MWAARKPEAPVQRISWLADTAGMVRYEIYETRGKWEMAVGGKAADGAVSPKLLWSSRRSHRVGIWT